MATLKFYTSVKRESQTIPVQSLLDPLLAALLLTTSFVPGSTTRNAHLKPDRYETS